MLALARHLDQNFLSEDFEILYFRYSKATAIYIYNWSKPTRPEAETVNRQSPNSAVTVRLLAPSLATQPSTQSTLQPRGPQGRLEQLNALRATAATAPQPSWSAANLVCPTL